MRQRLTLHPASACAAVTAIEVEVTRSSRALTFDYLLAGEIGDLILPPPVESRREDELWKQSCFEAFLSAAPGYYELNFSPSTAWAAYRFDEYRAGMRHADIAPPAIETRAGPDRFELRAQVALPNDLARHLGLSAVIEEKNGNKSWWALAHPPGAPDFHHADCFALELSSGPPGAKPKSSPRT